MKNSTFNPQEQELHLSSKVVAGLERISEVFKVLLWEQATAIGLSPIQIQILIFVAYHKPNLCNVSHLAREFNITKPTVSDAIRVLENKELIRKHQSSEDRRSYSIELTNQGQEIVGQTGHFSSPLLLQVHQLKSEELEGLWHSLSRLIHKLNRSGILTVQRTCFGCTYYLARNNGPDYCKLLKKDLHTADIRLDCPEYEDQGSGIR